MLGVLLKRRLIEKFSGLKKGRKNFDFIGIFLTILLTALITFVAVSVYSRFVSKYCELRIHNVLDVPARMYEMMTLAYTCVLAMSIISSTLALNRAIFESDDRNILMTLPIKSSTIFLSKIIEVYVMELIKTAVIILPINIVFVMMTEMGSAYMALSVLVCVLMPVLALSIASVLCLPVYFIKRFFMSNNILLFVTVTVCLAGMFYVYALLLGFVKTLMLSGEIKFFFSSSTLALIHKLSTCLYPANLLAKVVLRDQLGKNLLIVLALVAVLAVMGYTIVLLLYNKATKSRSLARNKKAYTANSKLRQNSVMSTLLIKEYRLIFHTPNYAISYFSIAVIMPMMVYFCLDIGSNMLSSLVIVRADFELALFVVVLFGALTNTFCATNISRDGKIFYMLKTMPIRPREILGAKILFSSIVSTLTVMVSTVIIISTKMVSVGEGIFIFFVGSALGIAQICFATRKDLNKPKFFAEEDNEVKESNSTVSTLILLGIISSLILGGVPLYYQVVNGIAGKTTMLFTYLFTSIYTLAVVGGALAYLFVGLRKRFVEMSEGEV